MSELKRYLKNIPFVPILYNSLVHLITKFQTILFDLNLRMQISLIGKVDLDFDQELSTRELTDKTSIYDKRVKDFLPKILKLHRKYFSKFSRGFGEEIFHLMWLDIFWKFKPTKILEIGVYRAQTLSLFSLLAEKVSISDDFEVHGLSPFDNSGDAVSNYISLDYLQDCKKNLRFFKCKNYFLHKELSTSPDAVRLIRDGNWDLVYIDGSHDYDIVTQDFANAFIGLKENGIIVLDDSSLYFEHELDSNRFWGHPGPSQVAREIAGAKMKHLSLVGHNNVFQKVKMYD
jgi:hypothetical protein